MSSSKKAIKPFLTWWHCLLTSNDNKYLKELDEWQTLGNLLSHLYQPNGIAPNVIEQDPNLGLVDDSPSPQLFMYHVSNCQPNVLHFQTWSKLHLGLCDDRPPATILLLDVKQSEVTCHRLGALKITTNMKQDEIILTEKSLVVIVLPDRHNKPG